MNNLKKIHDIEVTPPAGAWNNIARELDKLEEYQNLTERLTALEVAPPVMAWNVIANELDAISQEKILQKNYIILKHLYLQQPGIT
ncbi:hypothetical protein [Niabella hibiscisoli]|uniref:hypothetical protein n=1 Tax=Niabella hibiscisoli TaxID=1825928 RepID=UPI001F0F4606|nr:hypothetical protein [Niabella hibiscisoli]MCH5718101.1 hypothetical protein [Niabella hibiscisoli]